MFRIAPFRHRRGLRPFGPELFGDFFSWPESWPTWEGFNVDVKETSDGYELLADLPGVSKENIQVTLDNGYLVIAVRQDEMQSEDRANYIRRERRQMSSSRSFYVGDVQSADVSAKYDNGILKITFHKAEGRISSDRIIPIE